MSEQIIGFIGLSVMGEPMAGHLLDKGFRVVSCAHRNRDPFDRLAPKGLIEVDNARAVGEQADILMSMVFTEEQNDAILRGPNGAFASLKPGSVVIVMSTVTPAYCQGLAEEANSKGIAVLDCPVSGMPIAAQEGTLSLLIDGDESAIEKSRDALSAFGNIMPCGALGSGPLTKLGNNSLFMVQVMAIQQICSMLETHDVDVNVFMNNLNQSTGRSWVSQNLPPRKEVIKWPAMPIKDLTAALDAAKANNMAMPLIQHVLDTGL